jgi:hypothetical protein
MGAKPSPKHSIHRINNNSHYEPDNCKWATALEQAKNKRSSWQTFSPEVQERYLLAKLRNYRAPVITWNGFNLALTKENMHKFITYPIGPPNEPIFFWPYERRKLKGPDLFS